MIARAQSIDPFSRDNRGASGRLRVIPNPTASWEPYVARAADGEPIPQRHVVAVDDAPEIRALLADLLQSEGYRVSTFAAPPSLADLSALAPDPIVLDLLYHGQKSGLAFIAAMRADPALRGAPMVVCTGASDTARQAEADLTALDVGVILKPFDIETLLTEIARRIGASS
jgi:CheY-like chemotaxis protein